MALALIEMDGAGELRGVWVSAARSGAPQAAFIDDLAGQSARAKIDDAAGAVRAGHRTWEEFMEHIFQRQNHITIERVPVTTELSAACLLREIELLWPYWDL